MVEISVVIPVRNEEENINELANRTLIALQGIQQSFEIIFVTDINRDHTVDLLENLSKQDPHVKTIKLANCFGQHVAVMAGLDHCQGEYVVIMDGDLQDYPEDIPLLYNKILEGFDIVYTIKEKKNDNFFRNLTSRVFNGLMDSLSDVKLTSNSSMFRIISKKALREILKFKEYEPSLTYIFSFINLPTAAVPVRSGMRQRGETKYSLIYLFDFAISSILSFSRKPLRVISNLGFIMAFFSFIYFAVVIYQYFFHEIELMGWATIVAIITFTGGIQLLSLGVIGEYIGRIYMQTKNRPLYIVEERFGNFD